MVPQAAVPAPVLARAQDPSAWVLDLVELA
jgi:hypothetical protein